MVLCACELLDLFYSNYIYYVKSEALLPSGWKLTSLTVVMAYQNFDPPTWGGEGKARISLNILLRIDNRNCNRVQMDQLEDLLIIF